MSQLEAPVCGDLEVRPSWEINTNVQQGERNVGESCCDCAEVPTS